MASTIVSASNHTVEAQSDGNTCWPVVWLWVLSIAQYSYRYILQVSDPRTSRLYESTPAALSAIKYGIFALFGLYALYRFSQKPVPLQQRYRTLTLFTAASLLVLTSVLLVRIACLPGDMDETLLCGLQLAPWMASVFISPLLVKQKETASQTIRTFERVTFWIAFPFWLTTVILALSGIRYPALSYPGLIVRYGGILDDPNGYACLCLLLLVLCVTMRSGAWRLRAVLYVAMLIATVSLSGYATAIVMCTCWLLTRLARPTASVGLGVLRAVVICAMALSLVPLVATIYDTDEVVTAVTSMYSAKTRSAEIHLSDLTPQQTVLENSSLIEVLCGGGGFSENFYWRILANFGVAGLGAVVVTALVWSYHAAWRNRRWRYSIGIWGAGVLAGSNGMAYLLIFPLSLIYWSMLALLIATEEQN